MTLDPATRKQVLDLRGNGLSYRQIAQQTGLPYTTVWESVNIRGRDPILVDKKVSEFAYKEWCEWIEQGQKLKEKASVSQETADIVLGDGQKPQIIYQLGDLHIGAWGTDYSLLRQITEEIKGLDNCWVALMGDLLEMAINLRGVLEVCSQILPPEQQMQFLAAWLDEIKHRVCFAVWDNHGVERQEKFAGYSAVKHALGSRTVYFNGIGHPDIRVGEQVYRVAASHKFRGNSMYDSTWGPRRYARMQQSDRELIMQGDLHRPAISVYSEGGMTRVAVTSGTLHLNSGYAKRYFSLKTLPVFPAIVLHHDEHRIVPFWNLGEALTYVSRF